MCQQLFGEEIIGKFPCLLEAVDTFGDFKVYPTVLDVLFKAVLVDEFLGNLVDTNADIFWAVERRIKVEVGDICCCEKLCILLGADAVEDPFEVNLSSCPYLQGMQ